tara:strand:- start:50233 stop:51474 length:1242 start_codon:yes stop_codon:yes gene_type:complete
MKVAIIGGGVAGLAAAHDLSDSHEVTIYESAAQLGGHANAVLVPGTNIKVDTAFLIFNDQTYQHFHRFIRDLGVQDRSVSAEMSSCFSDCDHNFHYCLGRGLQPFLQLPTALVDFKFYQIMASLFRFKKKAIADLDGNIDLSRITVEEYLKPFSKTFVRNFILPLTAAIWSLPADKMLDFPILPMLKYFDNHQLLRGQSQNRWRTFQGSSAVYVEAFVEKFRGKIKYLTPVLAVRRVRDQVQLQTLSGTEIFDHVVLATHADVSLKLIQNPTELEKRLLGAWQYEDNPVTLHTDEGLMHTDSRLWGSWNMSLRDSRYAITYYLNRIQNINLGFPIFLTLGKGAFKEDHVLQRFNYRHPIFTEASIATQEHLPELNHQQGLSFCGSYFGYGFHEDAVKSAKQAADGIPALKNEH